ncbi:fasciclin domain-containing protein [Terrihabitans sp. B22-R8]|uniref:fasciclin domain-containing protein n=1 Tax=Terrihabitans sp. B22-R8 TaxID=3425128 RepID=UPI00403C87CA
MRRTHFLTTAAAICLSAATFAAAPAFAQGMMKKEAASDGMRNEASEKTVTVGGAPMYPSKNIVENAVNSKDHTTLVAAVKAAGLVDTLSGKGPFTVFAPTNAAFEKLPSGTVETLVKPENKKMLTGILTYHVVAGKHSAADIMADIKKGGGKATWKTVNGETLTASMKGDNLILTDAKGGQAMVTIGDVMQSNGVIHVVDTVLMPG